jgi:hypothetical protein
MRLGSNQRTALAAVRDGKIYHQHPNAWVVPLVLLEVREYRVWWNALQRLANQRLIKVHASSKEYQRPVEITDDGRALLERGQ